MKSRLSLCILLIGGLLSAIQLALSPPNPSPTVGTQAVETLQIMLQAVQRHERLQYKIKAWERFGDQMIHTENDVRLQVSPLKVYMKMWAPDKGVEVLFAEGERDNMALVKPAGFPYVNVKLNPRGGRMREDQHHTLLESGFAYSAGIVQAALNGAEEDASSHLSLETGVRYLNRDCYKLTIQHPSYQWSSYQPKAGETLMELAKRRYLPEYLIDERNPQVDGYGKLPSRSIQVPNHYGARVVLYIDREHYLPIGQYIYDDRGLFERYEFHHLDITPDWSNKEFSADCAAYGF